MLAALALALTPAAAVAHQGQLCIGPIRAAERSFELKPQAADKRVVLGVQQRDDAFHG